MKNYLDILLTEFSPDTDNDTEKMYLLKKIIQQKLTVQEQRILLIYADEMSLKKTAQYFNCTPQTVSNYIKKIREKIYEYYNKSYTDFNDSNTDN